LDPDSESIIQTGLRLKKLLFNNIDSLGSISERESNEVLRE